MKNIIIALLFLTLTGCGFEIVDTGNRGIETRYGKVIGTPLPEGIHFYNPLSSNIVEVNVRTLKWEGTTAPYTKDVQQATVTFVVNYNLDPVFAHTVYKELGEDWADALIPQVVNARIKDEFGQWDAAPLVSNRVLAIKNMTNSITDNLSKKHILVTSFEITNIDYSDVFEASVESKVVAAEKAKEEKNRTESFKEKAAQTVLTATADAASIKIKADALAQSAKLVEWAAIEKWDGKLPTYMLGGATPFINLSAK